MIVARRDMTLNGQPVVVGQVLDGIWSSLREMAQRNLLRQHWVEDVETPPNEPMDKPVVPKKGGRPKGSKNKPKPVAQASA